MKDMLAEGKNGVLGDIYNETNQEDDNFKNNPGKYLEKLHSLFFPYNWKEVIVSPERLLMINGKMNTPKEV